MKSIGKALAIFLFLSFFASETFAATTYDWDGSNSTAWNDRNNWQVGGSTPANYPGQTGTTDVVRIGVNTYNGNQPTLSTVINAIASLEFGPNSFGGGAVTLTITGVTLQVTGVAGVVQDNYNFGNTTTTITGTGTLSCTNFTLGNGTTPAFNSTATTTLTSTIATLAITTLTLNSNSAAGKFSNPVFNFTTGILNVTNIVLGATSFRAGNTSTFNTGRSTTANTVNISGSITVPGGIAGSVSFLSAAANTSASTVNYNGAAQTIYSEADAFVTSTPTTYGNLIISGSGTKTVDGSNLNIGGAWTTSGGTINLTSNPTVVVTGIWNNTTTVSEGSAGAITAASITNGAAGIINGNAAAGTTTITGAVTNNGTVTVNKEVFTFVSAFTNAGTFTGGTVTTAGTNFSAGVTNSATFNGGTGPIAITGNLSTTAGTFTGGTGASGTTNVTGTLTNTGGTVAGGTGAMTFGALVNTSGSITGNAGSGNITVNGTSSSGGTITANAGTILFTGLMTNSGTYTGGTGTSTFTAGLTNSNIVNEAVGTFTIGVLTNTGTFTGSTTTGTSTITTINNNAGTISVKGETLNVSGLATNAATYDATTGVGASNFNGGLTNTGTVKAGTGTIAITTFTNNSPGVFTGSASTGATNVTTLANATGATITIAKENITYSGAVTNAGLYTGGTGTTTTGLSIFNGTFTNNTGGAFNPGTSDITFNSDYTNTGSGTFTANATGNIIFGGAGAQSLTDNSTGPNGTIFNNVQFQGNSTKTMSGSPGFFVSSSGILTMIGTSTSVAAGGALTLNSGSTGSAIVAAIPAGCTITGNVTAARFIKGSSTDLTKRGYRLITSTVYNGTDPTAGNVFDLQYLTNYVYVSGYQRAANGFNVPTTDNPSLYLFREDDPPPPTFNTVFTTGYNWKGVAKLTGLTPSYATGTQAKTTAFNTFDSTVLLPVGNGVLFYFRGAGTSNAANYTAPFAFPADATLMQTGTLNTGTIQVKLWFAYSTLGTSFSFTSANTPGNSGSTSKLTAGFTLVGNPYPSTINWEKYNNTHAPSAITGGNGLSGIIYVYDPLSKQYESYTPSVNNANLTTEYVAGTPGGGVATGSASNYIASGQGFFIQANTSGQSLTFGETAKVSAQTNTTTLNALMGTPKTLAVAPPSLLRLKMITDSVNTDEIVIRLINGSSTKYVNGEDALDLGGSGALESLSAISSDSVLLSLNTLPFPGKQAQVIPILADATASGSYQLAMTQLSDLPALYSAWLKDVFTGDSVQLKLNTSYPFTIDKSNAATFGSSRFTVVIRQDPALAYQLLSFTADKVPGARQVQLVWKTANEQNYTNFTVERSTDNGKTFDVLGGMQGTGAGQYSLLDKDPEKGIIFTD